ncbi:DNA adenine methylase [Photobacterium leiognathi]|uniref:DNA adenine methylase n=1 Tax=Photobacterium leiognathi TaxID=553611 RepID=UPI001EE07D2C|nr:Dam family site-specific DNA-(adenine-N6)-methyltransferase [Photobacterium leiognathi]
MEPLLKWPGGKRWIAEELGLLYKRLQNKGVNGITEPFAGGASISFVVEPENVQLNDIISPLTDLYSEIKANDSFSLSGINILNTEDNYLKNREIFNQNIKSGTTEKNPALFYYMNRTGYRGMVRFNKLGEFNISFGNYAKPILLDDFSAYHQFLKRAEITNGCFQELKVKQSHMIFSDPPYDDGWVGYSENGFDMNKQTQHAHWLASHKNPIVTTNKATPRIVSLYKSLGFTVKTYSARRSISAKKNSGEKVKEMIAFLNIKPSDIKKICFLDD